LCYKGGGIVKWDEENDNYSVLTGYLGFRQGVIDLDIIGLIHKLNYKKLGLKRKYTSHLAAIKLVI